MALANTARPCSYLLALITFAAVTGGQEAEPVGGPVFEQLSARVTAVLQPQDNQLNDANAIVLKTGAGVVVIDAPADADTVRRTIERISSLSSHPVRFLINTHWHGDHTQGNQIYRERYGDSLRIVGHETLIADVPERAGAYIEEQRVSLADTIPRAEQQLALGLSLGGDELDPDQLARQRLAIDQAKSRLAGYAGLKLLTPELTYNDRLTLYLGGLEIRLLHFKAHTAGDTVVYLPGEKLLLTGDLLDAMPFAGHGYLESWVETLDQLAELDFERIVPGHGPVFEGKQQLRQLRDYFHTIVEGCRAAVARGDDLETAQASLDLTRFRSTLAGDDATLQSNFDAYAPEAIARAFEQLSGAAPGPAH